MRQTAEPTVEEILESIKKVIARDNRAGADEQRRQRETQGVVAPSVHQAKDLEADQAADDEALFDEEDVLDLGSASEFAMTEEDGDDDDRPESPLLTETARVSMQESLAALAMLAEPGVPPQIVRSGETSLEGMARELLRPALAEWLDKNLPQMVERMVASEIARIVGKKG